MNEIGVPLWLADSDILPAARRVLDCDVHEISTWTGRLLSGGGVRIGVWRVEGTARSDTGIRSWSFILKGWAAPETTDSLQDLYWYRREFDMYRSGLLDDLPGELRAPACYGASERPDGSVWVWLEDIVVRDDGFWTMDHYAKVARAIGRFNAGYLMDRALPDLPALSRGWLQQWTEASEPSMTTLWQEANHPLVQRVYPRQVIDILSRDWEARDQSYELLKQSPSTFSHLDVYSRNVFFHSTTGDTHGITLIDWGYAGIASVGEELAPLVAASMLMNATPLSEGRALSETVLKEYLHGLRDAGWADDPNPVQAVYKTAIRLRYGVGVVRILLPILLNEEQHPGLEELMGRPMEELTAYWADFNAWLAGIEPS